MDVNISKGNRKMGNIWNLSLPPIKTCASGVPCSKACYALNSYRRFKNVRMAWDENLDLWEADPLAFNNSIRRELSIPVQPRFFRWHVSGDIIDDSYFKMMCGIAIVFPDIKFLAFTKRYDIVNNSTTPVPPNLKIVFSGWPGLKMNNPRAYPVAWMQDGTETRMADNALECPGNCESCAMCWTLDDVGRDVVFMKH